MIGYLSGKFLNSDDGGVIVDVNGVGYSVLVPARMAAGFASGAPIELFVHTHLRENALELFGFQNSWEKRVFLALTSVSGVGPRTALSVLSGLEPEMILSAIVREDRATLTSVSGIGKKTAERLLIELGDKARKLLAERPSVGQSADPRSSAEDKASKKSGKKNEKQEKQNQKQDGEIPQQGATAASVLSNLDVADLWNEALAALVNLGYREVEAIAAIKMASNKAVSSGSPLTLEKLIMTSLQLMSRGM